MLHINNKDNFMDSTELITQFKSFSEEQQKGLPLTLQGITDFNN